MALHLDPFEREPLPGERKVRAADIRHEWQVSRDGIEVIATPIPAGSHVECGFCGHGARAREFLVRDIFDTVANEAYLVARLA